MSNKDNKTKIKGIRIEKNVLDTINKNIDKDFLNLTLKELLYELYNSVSDECIEDNTIYFENNYNRLSIQYQLLKSDLANVTDEIKRLYDEKRNLENKIHSYESEKNTMENVLTGYESKIVNMKKVLTKNIIFKENIVKKILLDYKNNNLDSDVLNHELKNGNYIFEVLEFKQFFRNYTKDKINSIIILKDENYLLSNNVNENTISDEYKLYLTEKIVENILKLCDELSKFMY